MLWVSSGNLLLSDSDWTLFVPVSMFGLGENVGHHSADADVQGGMERKWLPAFAAWANVSSRKSRGFYPFSVLIKNRINLTWNQVTPPSALATFLLLKRADCSYFFLS